MSSSVEWSDVGEVVDESRKAEIALVQRAQLGDADAFADLVRRYQRLAVSVAFRLLNNAEDAADVSQDAFVRAYRHLGQLDDAARFGPWFLRTVSNLSLNFRRGRKNRAALPLDDVEQATGSVRSPLSGQPLAEVRHAAEGPLPDELQELVNDALAALPDKQRLALILFSVEGMPQKEVAEILECTIELVKWNVFQARKKLREALKEHL